jgi:glycosyltransferase involved in cell wall biosynthesis
MLDEGWRVEGLFLDGPVREGRLRTWRFPLDRNRASVMRYVFEYLFFFLWSLGWLTWRCLMSRPALVYVNSPPDAFVFAALVPRLLRVPVVLDVHDPMPELFVSKGRSSKLVQGLLRLQERWSLRFADRVITVHEPLRELLHSRSPGIHIDVVMNVSDVEGWEPIQRHPEKGVVVFTGTVALRYGLDDVLHALVEVKDAIPEICLRIVGEGEDEELLRGMADSLGIGDRVEFMGRVSHREIPGLLADAWVGVNVPKPDDLGGLSFSNKIVEWVLLGVPVIAGRTSTLLRYFPEDTLRYVEAGSATEIADALRDLASLSPSRRDAQLAAAREAVEAISWRIQRARLIEILTGVRDGARLRRRTSGPRGPGTNPAAMRRRR